MFVKVWPENSLSRLHITYKFVCLGFLFYFFLQIRSKDQLVLRNCYKHFENATESKDMLQMLLLWLTCFLQHEMLPLFDM